MANDADWFKIYPAKYLSIAARIPDGTQRAEFLSIVLHCLDQGSLPDDDDEIAFITAISPERIKLLRPYLARLCKAEDSTIIPHLAADTIAERREFSEKKAKAGQKGAKQKLALLSTAKQKLAVLSSAKHISTQLSQTDRQTCIEKENNREREEANPLSHPLGVALLNGAGFNVMQRETLSPLNYSKLGAAVTRLTQAQITPAQIQAARENWWGSSPPNFDQLADEALKVANGTGANSKQERTRTHYLDGREIPAHLRKVVV